MNKNAYVYYKVEAVSPQAHLFQVTLSIEQPDVAGETLSLPVWIPGSYMIREFAKNIVSLNAQQGGKPIALTALDKHRWQTGRLKKDTALTVVAQIYAWDLSVRCAHLDASHGFFNGTQMFLCVEEREQLPHFVELCRPIGGEDAEEYAEWNVATTLKPARGKKQVAKSGSFGLYRAENYDELIDHPVEMGTFDSLKFNAAGTPHQMVVTGKTRFDKQRLQRDLEVICSWHINLFGTPAPFSRYLFMTMAVGDGYGGLEHRDSTALICSRSDLPIAGVSAMGERYRTFLGLCSHEYFHAWNVKRIKPAAFSPYRLNEENYTRLLWVFEGFTSYYDDLALVRTGLISQQDYLGILAKTIAGVERGTGRLKQSVAESSFDAWTKYYRQDENSPNAVVSYYTKGSLVAAGLDLTIRAATAGKRSLDDVMRYLWSTYGQTGRGVGEAEMPAIIQAATGVGVSREIALWAEGTQDVPLEKLFKLFGIELVRKQSNVLSGLGIRTRAEGAALKLTHVLDNGAMQKAGASAGDEMIALDSLRVTPNNLESLLMRYQKNDSFELMLFRRDELLTLQVKLDAPLLDERELKPLSKPTVAMRKLCKGWLGE